jgi:glutamate carboxypeptidase
MKIPDPLVRRFEERTPEMVELISELARLDTPTGDGALQEEFLRRYGSLLEEAGARVQLLAGPEGACLRAEFEGRREAGLDERSSARAEETGGNGILLVGHSDTVWPRGEAGRRPPRLEDGRLSGPGVYDMKAGLALMVFLLRDLRESGSPPARPLRLFISSDEEGGSTTSRAHLPAAAGGCSLALVLEPPREDGGLKVVRKGVAIYRLLVRGRAAHAGVEPGRGASAIEDLVLQLARIAGWKDPARGIAINLGRVEGGIASNVVPDQAWAEIDIRFDRPEDGEEMARKLRSLETSVPGTSLHLEGGVVFPPMTPDERTAELVEEAVEIAAGLGMRLSAGSSGGGSDGSLLAAQGLAVLDGLGVEGGGAHTREEHVLVDRLAFRAALLSRLVLELKGP